MVKFKTWIRDSGLTYEEVGRKLGVTGQTIYNITSGRRQPGHKLSRQIVDLVGGEVTLTDLRPDLWP